MVEETLTSSLGLGDPASMIAGAGQNIFLTLMIVFWVLIVGGVIFFILWYSSFKIVVIIREVTNKRRYVTSDKAKIKIVDGVEYYYLRKRRVYLNIPPPEAMEITVKGRFFCEVYHNGSAGKNTGYYWIKDDTEDIKSVTNTNDAFTPLKTERQAQLVNRLRRAEARRGKSLWEKVVPIVMSVSMIIIIAIPFIFYGELTEANKLAMEETKYITNAQAKMTEELAKMTDVLTGKLSRDELVFVQDIAMDEQIKPPEVSE